MERHEALLALINDFFDFSNDPNTILLLYNKAGEADDRLLLKLEPYLLRKLLFLDKDFISVNRCLFLFLLLFAPPNPLASPPSYID